LSVAPLALAAVTLSYFLALETAVIEIVIVEVPVKELMLTNIVRREFASDVINCSDKNYITVFISFLQAENKDKLVYDLRFSHPWL
jgi:hypothetical protein